MDAEMTRKGGTSKVKSPQCNICANKIKGDAMHCLAYVNDEEKPKDVLRAVKECTRFTPQKEISIIEYLLQIESNGLQCDAGQLFLKSLRGEYSNKNIYVIIKKILGWIRLEAKKSIWIQQGRPTKNKPLMLSSNNYPWEQDLKRLMVEESVFNSVFCLNGDAFEFASTVSEDSREDIRKNVYERYTPDIHILWRKDRPNG